MRVLLTAAASVLVVVSGSAAVGAAAYPPVNRQVTASPASGEPGYPVNVTARCDPGETVRIELAGSAIDAPCNDSDEPGTDSGDNDLRGKVTALIDAPPTAGDHKGSAGGTSSGDLGRFVIRVDPVVPASATTAAPTSDAIEWGQVLRYSAWGAMVVAFCAVLVGMRRRFEMT